MGKVVRCVKKGLPKFEDETCPDFKHQKKHQGKSFRPKEICKYCMHRR